MNVDGIKKGDYLKKIGLNNRLVIVIVAIIVVFVAMFVVLNNWVNGDIGKVAITSQKMPGTDIDKKIFEDYRFKRLATFLNTLTTVGTGDVGRDNPFINYK